MKTLQIIIFFIYLLIFNGSVYADKILFPLNCELGQSCWVSMLPRHHFQHKQFDFRCGPITYEYNDGTHIALRDIKQMQEGVKVISPINGIIEFKRDGINDISAKGAGRKILEGKECGNEIVISNDEMQVKFCHLKNKSIRVEVGDEVKAGELIGEVGLSGLTEYPHLHMSFYQEFRT